MSKITLRIPCKEPYAYVEAILEDADVGEGQAFQYKFKPEKIKEKYDELYALMNPSASQICPNKAFYEYLVSLANSDLTKWGTSEHYESLNDEEKSVCQAFKRFVKRLPVIE